MTIALLKYFHIVAVATSFALFFVRGIWVIRSLPAPQEPWLRALPYLVDTVMVASAVAIMLMTPVKGWSGNWLTVKLALLAVYAALGLYLFFRARHPAVKIALWFAALVLFLFVTSISVLREPLGILSVL